MATPIAIRKSIRLIALPRRLSSSEIGSWKDRTERLWACGPATRVHADRSRLVTARRESRSGQVAGHVRRPDRWYLVGICPRAPTTGCSISDSHCFAAGLSASDSAGFCSRGRLRRVAGQSQGTQEASSSGSSSGTLARCVESTLPSSSDVADWSVAKSACWAGAGDGVFVSRTTSVAGTTLYQPATARSAAARPATAPLVNVCHENEVEAVLVLALSVAASTKCCCLPAAWPHR